MAITKQLTYTLPAVGSRSSTLQENADGTATCTYRPTDTANNTWPSVFTGADIVAAWAANESYFAALQAANPTIDSVELAARLTFVRAVLKAYGDAASGFTVT